MYDKRVVLENFTTVPYGCKDVIRFDRNNKEFGFMLNDYQAPVTIEGKVYQFPDAYLMCKKLDPEYQNRLFNYESLCDQIRSAPTVQDAQHIANRPNAFRKDWDSVQRFIGLRAVNAKFKENEAIKHRLLATGKRSLVYVDNDPFWGTGPDGNGQNQLGQTLENVRKRLKIN